jgi:MEDS: MEthanogen/methylotroph, DcmR Sensory domain
MSTPPHPHIAEPVRPHAVQFYSEDEHLLHSIAELIEETLSRGDAVICAVSRPHGEQLAQFSRMRGPMASKAVVEGRYLPLNAEDTLAGLMQDGELNPKRFAKAMSETLEQVRKATGKKDAKVVAVGVMVGLLWAQRRAEDVIRLEGMWNDLAGLHVFSLHCCYPIAAFDHPGDQKSFLTICSSTPASSPVQRIRYAEAKMSASGRSHACSNPWWRCAPRSPGCSCGRSGAKARQKRAWRETARVTVPERAGERRPREPGRFRAALPGVAARLRSGPARERSPATVRESRSGGSQNPETARRIAA